MAALIRYEDYNGPSLVGRFPHKSLLTSLYYAWEGRNTWQGVGWWYYNSAFCFSFDEARKWVEKNRKQGSQWQIVRLPSIVFVSDELSLFVTEISGFLDKYPFDRNLSPLLEDIADNFQPKSGGRTVRLVADSRRESMEEAGYSVHESYSQGGNYPLGWTPDWAPKAGGIRSFPNILIWQERFGELLTHRGFSGLLEEEQSRSERSIVIYSGSPAGAAGIRAGDTILWIRNECGDEFLPDINLISKLEPGERIDVGLRRGKEKKVVEIVLCSFADYIESRR